LAVFRKLSIFITYLGHKETRKLAPQEHIKWRDGNDMLEMIEQIREFAKKTLAKEIKRAKGRTRSYDASASACV